MDKSVKTNVSKRMDDHKAIVRKELLKYRETNQSQIKNHFNSAQMVQVQYVPMYYPP